MQRRQQYRVEVGDARIGVELRVGDGSWLKGRPTDLTIGGSGARFSLQMLGARCPGLDLGDEVELRFTAAHLPKPITITARVAHRADDGATRQFGFRFTGSEELSRTLPPVLFPLFNRRESFRVQAPPGMVAARIEHRGGPPVDGFVHDLSVSGIGLRVPATAAPQLEGIDTIAMLVTLPGSPAPIDLAGTISNQRLVGSHVHLGVRFDPDDAARHESVLSEYVMACQRAMLRIARSR